MFRRIQNESLKKDCIWVRIRGAFLAKKGAPKLNFHREGGAVAPICPPPKSATGRKTTLFDYFSPISAEKGTLVWRIWGQKTHPYGRHVPVPSTCYEPPLGFHAPKG